MTSPKAPCAHIVALKGFLLVEGLILYYMSLREEQASGELLGRLGS